MWLVQRPLGVSGELYVSFRQAVDPVLTLTLPPLGALAITATVIVMVAGWSQVRARWLAPAALGCLAGALAVTVGVHFPINAEIATWAASSPPPGWQALRDRWVDAHAVRTALTIAAFALLVTAERTQSRAVA